MREQFTHFGGHHMAAGMTLPVENIPLFKNICHTLLKNQIDMANGQELLISESLAVSRATTTFIDQLRILAPLGLIILCQLLYLRKSRLRKFVKLVQIMHI